jgi:hypothetical protein
MKKTYLTPALELLGAETEQQMLLASSTIGINKDPNIDDPSDVLAPDLDLDGFFSADQDLDSYFD